jgi:hypothetical protein
MEVEKNRSKTLATRWMIFGPFEFIFAPYLISKKEYQLFQIESIGT